MRFSTKAIYFSLTLVAILSWATAPALPDGRLHVVFLDVGQGDAVFVTTPHGRQVLIDGGPDPLRVTSQLGRQMPFWDRSIDVLVSTHPDADHLTGLVEVLARYRVETVLVSDADAETAIYDAWQARLESAHLEAQALQTGASLQLDTAVSALVLHPGPATLARDEPNNHSVTLRLTFGRISFLLPGDIEQEIEEALVRQGLPLQATVLKSPHHGSSTSSSPAFLDAVNPQLIVISVGADNRFGHPTQAVLDRYAERGLRVLRTDELGAIELVTDGVNVWLGD